jgi:hypothetical protein
MFVVWLKALTCSDYGLLPLAGTWTRQAVCPLRKELWLDGCLGVEPRGMESLWLKSSATCRVVFWPRASLIEGGAPWPFFSIPVFNCFMFKNFSWQLLLSCPPSSSPEVHLQLSSHILTWRTWVPPVCVTYEVHTRRNYEACWLEYRAALCSLFKRRYTNCKGTYSRQTMRWSLRGVNILSGLRGEYRACRWTEDFLLVSSKVT